MFSSISEFTIDTGTASAGLPWLRRLKYHGQGISALSSKTYNHSSYSKPVIILAIASRAVTSCARPLSTPILGNPIPTPTLVNAKALRGPREASKGIAMRSSDSTGIPSGEIRPSSDRRRNSVRGMQGATFPYTQLQLPQIDAFGPHRTRVLVFMDRKEWQTAAIDSENIDFGGIAPPAGAEHFNTPVGLTLSGVKFVGFDHDPRKYCLGVVSATANPYVSAWGPEDKLLGGFEIQVSFPAGVTAFGSDIMVTFQAFIGIDAFYTVILSAGYLLDRVISTPPPDRAFIGVTCNEPISWVKFISSGTFPMLGNFSFGAKK